MELTHRGQLRLSFAGLWLEGALAETGGHPSLFPEGEAYSS